MQKDLNKQFRYLLSAVIIPLVFVFILWIIHFINIQNLDLELYKLGIYPRKASGLWGTLFSPLLHSTRSFEHIFNNSIPLLVLGTCMFYFYPKISYKVILFIWAAGGFWVWVAARSNYHIGASGVIYGMVFFLFFSGVFKKNKNLMAISLLVAFLYGSLVWGIFPQEGNISYEGHFFGALAGTIAAFYFRNRKGVHDKEPPPPIVVDDATMELYYQLYEPENNPYKINENLGEETNSTDNSTQFYYTLKRKNKE